jgi:IPT/TIG domain
MATLPTQVRPGDLITSELINAILEKLALTGEAGTEVVPNVFGALLGDARAAILAPTRQLTMGFTFDVTGAAVDSAAGANFNRIVVSQSPTGESRVAPNTPVNLVVSGTGSGGGGGTVPTPTITRMETLGGTVATSFAVNGTLVIVGTNFSATASQNSVRFDGTPATSVNNDPADPTRRLVVVVPPGIPGAPVNPGDPPRAGVVVSVSRLGGTAVTTTVTITAPVPDAPSITLVDPATANEGTNITITGTGFTAAAQVRIRGTLATNVGTPTSTTIVATVPQFADINPGPPVPSTLVVSIPGVGDASFTGFRVRGV